MASFVAVEDAYRMLLDMFKSLDPVVVRKVFDDHEEHPSRFDASMNELLTLHALKEQEDHHDEQAREEDHVQQSDAPNPQAFEEVGRMFPDLSRSVIGGALFQNEGQVNGAIDLLINIGEDKDALDQIRDMNPEKKAEVRQKEPISISTVWCTHTQKDSLPAFHIPFLSPLSLSASLRASFATFRTISQPSRTIY